MHRALVKEAAWVASNVAAGRPEHRDALIAQGSTSTLTALLVSGQLDMQREAAFAMWNLVSHGGERLSEAVQTPGVLDAFVGLLSVPAPCVVRYVEWSRPGGGWGRALMCVCMCCGFNIYS